MTTFGCDNLEFGYGALPSILTDLSLTVTAGELVAITGPSGRGKSTLLYLLGLMLTPRSGEVLLDGRPVSGLPDAHQAAIRARLLGFVFQDAALDQTRTVLDNITEVCLYGDLDRQVARERALVLIEQLGVQVPADRRPGQVSGGQAQRIALCRALVHDPMVLLADEPTGNLDDVSADGVIDAMRSHARTGRAVIVVTHDPRLERRLRPGGDPMSRRWRWWRKVLAEAWAMAISQRVASGLTLVLVAGMSATVLLTAGRTAAAESAILSSIDSAGSRAVVVRAEPKAGLDSSVVARVSSIRQVEWVGAFGTARDATNGGTGGDTASAVRTLYTTDLAPFGITNPLPGACYASSDALNTLGMPDATGYLVDDGTLVCDIAGRLTTPDFLTQFEPIVVIPRPPADPDTNIALVVALARGPADVAAVANATSGVLGAVDPSGVNITASPDIARLRALVQGQLGGFGRSLTLTLTVVLALLVGALLFGLVMIRRKDFGRRRALGATRSLIVTLVSLSTLFIAIAASVIGATIALATLTIGGEPLPGWDFITATCILTTAAAGLGAIPPSIVAARRDPLAELRVP